ncbi:MAG TPA: glycosyl transferase [Clostridia bacterium]|nr:glycosyl transferase [Clostridia bacterium]
MQWAKVREYIKNPYKVVNYLGARGRLNFLPDELYLKLKYYACLGKNLNLANPTTYNEKIQWLKLHNRKPIYTKMSDKFEVRQYVAAAIGEEYLIPLLGVWEKFEDIDFRQLPEQFVLKCTHDSGGVVICQDKKNFDVKAARQKINSCLRRNYYYHGREWAYKGIKPRIICEKYLTDEFGSELIDYKVWCFDGKAKCIKVCSNRYAAGGLKIDFYDLNWEVMPFKKGYPNSGTIIPKPKNFAKMIELAEKLSKDIPFLRVDFYDTKEHLYFGEFTFYPGSGLEKITPESYDYLLGSWINLPQGKSAI